MDSSWECSAQARPRSASSRELESFLDTACDSLQAISAIRPEGIGSLPSSDTPSISSLFRHSLLSEIGKWPLDPSSQNAWDERYANPRWRRCSPIQPTVWARVGYTP